MPATFDQAKCEQRRRLAARRDAVEAVPMRLFQAQADPMPDSGLLYAQGTLPNTPDKALAVINSLLPEGSPALSADQVYIHYMEAANNSFISDRFMFLDETTLRNLAKDAQAGVAFMNSHRDGSLSHPADLPMGRTFAGRYEQNQDGTRRTLIGMYMLRGMHPNGAQGPSTDDLHASIIGGTTFDASVGLYGGEKMCDVCGNPVQDSQLCTHAPGTHRNMTADQRAAQKGRGVKDGKASYSLLHAHMGEVSAVYDGAVPGAGFRKTLSLARAHQLSRADSRAAASAYAGLWQTGDLDMDVIGELRDTIRDGFREGFAELRGRGNRATLLEAEPIMVTSQILSTADPEKEELRAKLAAAEAREAAQQQETCARLAKMELDSFILANKVYPAQNSDGQGTAVLAFLLNAPGTIRLTSGADVTPAEAFRQFCGAAVPHTLTTEAIPVQLFAAGPQPGQESEEIRATREAAAKFAEQANRTGLRVIPAH